MRVILTRPDGSNQALAARLEAAGMEVIVRPLIAIAQLHLGHEGQRLVEQLERFDAAIFVSRHAANYGMEAIDRYWPALPQGLSVYAVGPGTAAALAAYGVEAVTPKTPGSEGLLTLPGLQAVQGKEILIAKGQGGRALLQDTLTHRGAKVACLESYQRRPLPLEAADLPSTAATTEAMALTSGDILASFLASGHYPPGRFIALVPSARVAALAQQSGFKKVINVGAASDQALYDAVCAINTKGNR